MSDCFDPSDMTRDTMDFVGTFESCDMHRVEAYKDVLEGPDGSFYWAHFGEAGVPVIRFKMPYIADAESSKIGQCPALPEGWATTMATDMGFESAWTWDGDQDKPTLKPSILHKDGGRTMWHGWVRAGKLVGV